MFDISREFDWQKTDSLLAGFIFICSFNTEGLFILKPTEVNETVHTQRVSTTERGRF